MLEKHGKIRKWAQRFRSELYFLKKIMKPGMSVLDAGCAVGDLYHGLKEEYKKIKYVGIDSSENLITRARALAPEAKFILSNIFESEKELGNRKFDLVTATGVFQHEPKHERLLRFMVNHVKNGGYILFDVKLFYSHPTLRDIKFSYCDFPDPVYFIVLNLRDFMKLILPWSKITDSISVYGYYSGVHQSVHLPSLVKEEVCSAHILLQRSKKNKDKLFNLNLTLPEIFIKNYFMDLSNYETGKKN